MNTTISYREHFCYYYTQKLREEQFALTEETDYHYSEAIQHLACDQLDDAMEHFIACDPDNFTAKFFIALISLNLAEPESPHLVEEISFMKHLAECNYPDAMYILGYYYMSDDCPEKNLEQSTEWLKRAAQAGHPQGMYEYGYSLDTGRGISQDPEEAFLWYQKAADAEVAPAQYEVAMRLLNEENTPQNLHEAACYLAYAAEKDHPDALAELAQLYLHGKGVLQDERKAYHLCEKSFKLGSAKGAFGLSFFYGMGQVVNLDTITAVWLLKKARPAMNAEADEQIAKHIMVLKSFPDDEYNYYGLTMLAWLNLSGLIDNEHAPDPQGMLRTAASQGNMLAKCLLHRYFPTQDIPEAATSEECASFFFEVSQKGELWAARELCYMILQNEVQISPQMSYRMINHAIKLGDLILENELNNIEMHL